MSDYELRGVRLKDVYRDRDGSLWEVISLCDQPTATFQRVHDTDRVDHVIGCPNMLEQFPGGPLREREKDEALLRNALPKIRTNDGIPEGWYVSIGEDGVPQLGRIRG